MAEKWYDEWYEGRIWYLSFKVRLDSLRNWMSTSCLKITFFFQYRRALITQMKCGLHHATGSGIWCWKVHIGKMWFLNRTHRLLREPKRTLGLCKTLICALISQNMLFEAALLIGFKNQIFCRKSMQNQFPLHCIDLKNADGWQPEFNFRSAKNADF